MVKLLNLLLHGRVMRQQKGTKAKIVSIDCHTQKSMKGCKKKYNLY